MSQTPRRSFRLRPVVRVAATIAVLVGVAWAMRWSVGYPVPLARSLPTTAAFDQLLIGVIALMAWVVFGWACIVVTIELATALPGALGRQFAKLANVVTPAAVRRLAQAAIGFSILVGPMTPGRAFAADGGSASPATSAAVVAGPIPTASSLVPLDRPVAEGRLTIDLDRPTQPFLPAPPIGLSATAARPTTPAAQPVPTRTVSPSTAALAAGVPQRESTSLNYVVRRGDALWDVAARHLGPGASAADISREWPRWYAANRGVIGPDPDLIHPGDVLVPPPL